MNDHGDMSVAELQGISQRMTAWAVPMSADEEGMRVEAKLKTPPNATGSRTVAAVAALLLLAGCADGDVAGGASVVDAPMSADAAGAGDAPGADVAVVDGDPATLDGPGEVVIDVDGIPHVYASTDADALFLQGWATARHRMFQMDLTRRRALGQRAEVLGEGYWASDLQSRALRFGDWGRRTHEALAQDDPELLRWFEAYVAGVNAWMSAAKAGEGGAALSPQFAALGYEPAPWTVDDTLAIEKLIAAGLSMRPDQDITLGLIDLLLGADLFADLYRFAPFDREYVVPGFSAGDGKADGAGPPGAGREALRAASVATARAQLRSLSPEQVAGAIKAARGLGISGGGSNNWVLSGAHTQSGAPMIAGDSHQGISHPAVYYYIHLSTKAAGGTLDVVGASFPGVPFVVFGHNGTAAFMPTTSIYDAADVYLEELDPAAGTVQYEGKAVPVDVRKETIRVRGAGAVEDAEAREVTLYDVPHHGPLLPAEALGLPLPLDLAVRWTGYRPISLGRAFYALDTAASFDDLRAALDRYSSGGMHWVYADTHGDIGYSSRVELPIREVVDPATPPIKLLPGGGGFEWQTDAAGALRILDRSQVPWVGNPASGFVSTANNDPIGQTDDETPFDDPVYLSGIFDIGTRALRPRLRFEQARASGKLSLDDVAAIQLDDWSRLGERLRPFVLEAAERRPDLVTPSMKAALEVLSGWDLRCGVDSAGAVVFHGWLAAFARTVLSDEGGGLLKSVLIEDLDSKIGLVVTKFLTHWLEATAKDIDAIDAGTLPFPSASGADFWDDKGTPSRETRDQAILVALGDAVAELTTIFGAIGDAGADPADPASWRWGRWHTMQLVDAADAVLSGASSAALPKAGCLYTVDVGDYDWLVGGKLPERLRVTNAPSDRFVLEMRPDGVVGRAILPGGEDERPGARHHNDQLPDFLAGLWRPLRFSHTDVDAGAEERLALPAGFGAPAR